MIELFVYVVTWSAPADIPASWLTFLDSDERLRIDSMQRARKQYPYCAAHILRRLALAKRLRMPSEAIQFHHDHYGAPTFVRDGSPSSVAVSLSHTDDAVAVAIAIGSTQMVGVDIELNDRDAISDELISHGLGKHELERFRALPMEERVKQFLNLWVIKEAVSKAEGLGRRLGFERIRYVPPKTAVVCMGDGETEHSWRIWQNSPNLRHHLAVAAPADCPEPHFQHMTLEQLTGWCVEKSAKY